MLFSGLATLCNQAFQIPSGMARLMGRVEKGKWTVAGVGQVVLLCKGCTLLFPYCAIIDLSSNGLGLKASTTTFAGLD